MADTTLPLARPMSLKELESALPAGLTFAEFPQDDEDLDSDTEGKLVLDELGHDQLDYVRAEDNDFDMWYDDEIAKGPEEPPTAAPIEYKGEEYKWEPWVPEERNDDGSIAHDISWSDWNRLVRHSLECDKSDPVYTVVCRIWDDVAPIIPHRQLVPFINCRITKGDITVVKRFLASSTSAPSSLRDLRKEAIEKTVKELRDSGDYGELATAPGVLEYLVAVSGRGPDLDGDALEMARLEVEDRMDDAATILDPLRYPQKE